MSGRRQTSERDGDPALYRRIRAELEDNILSGRWPPGHRIPFEHELMAHYGCARMTVSRAVSALVDAGLVERRRRAGTFVARRTVESAVLTIPVLAEEVAARGMRYGYRLIARSRRVAGDGDRRDFAVEAGADILEVRSLHLADDAPFVEELRIIHLAAVPAAADLAFDSTPPGAWLVENVPWTEAEHRIFAVNPPAETARVLGVAKSAACLCLERRTWRHGVTVTFARQTFRGDMYHLAARFVPGS